MKTTTDARGWRIGSLGRWQRMSFTVAPDSEAHQQIAAVAQPYRTFALIAHLRDAHGLTEVMPERAAIAHSLFTRHENALAQPMTARRSPCRHHNLRETRRVARARRR